MKWIGDKVSGALGLSTSMFDKLKDSFDTLEHSGDMEKRLASNLLILKDLEDYKKNPPSDIRKELERTDHRGNNLFFLAFN